MEGNEMLPSLLNPWYSLIVTNNTRKDMDLEFIREWTSFANVEGMFRLAQDKEGLAKLEANHQ